MKWYINQYGIKTGCIKIPGINLAGTYITANGWVDESHIVVSAHNDLNTLECSLLLIDIESGQSQCVVENAKWPCFCVHNGVLYHTYKNNIYCTVLKTGASELIYENVGEEPFEGPPGITNDGGFISLQHRDKMGNTAIDLFSTKDKQLITVHHSSFFAPFERATHSMVNPLNPNEIFFCHEGDCRYITNRMWIYRHNTNKAENFYRQRLDENGANGDCCGHEMWTKNGNHMFFVKYPASTINPKGIFRINVSNGCVEHIAGKYPYWHVGVYNNGELLAGDTMEEKGDIHVILISGNTEKIIADAKTTWKHPVHPHPVFSPSGKRLYFTTVGDDNQSIIKICKL